MAEYYTENYAAAMQNLSTCLKWEEEIWKVDDTGQFNSEKGEMLEHLENIALWEGQVHEAAKWRAQKMQVVEQIAAMDVLL